MLKIEDLHYSVDENGVRKEILKGVNLEFDDNKIYVITGPNGSGKSTLAKIIMGILSQDKGKIFFNENEISSMAINERAKLGLTFAFQKPVTFKGLKISQLLDLASGTKNNVGVSCEYLSNVGLCAKNYIDRNLDDKLSGGEIKRIELAMALAKNGKVNIFDEPEAGIDLWSFENLVRLFSSIKDSTNIIISHQQKILELADEIILLKNGKVECTGSFDEILPLLENNKCGKLN